MTRPRVKAEALFAGIVHFSGGCTRCGRASWTKGCCRRERRQLSSRLCFGGARELVPSESWRQLSADGKAEPCSHLRHMRVLGYITVWSPFLGACDCPEQLTGAPSNCGAASRLFFLFLADFVLFKAEPPRRNRHEGGRRRLQLARIAYCGRQDRRCGDVYSSLELSSTFGWLLQ